MSDGTAGAPGGNDPETTVARVPKDGCVVDAAPLSEMVNSFVDRWNRDRPPTAGRFDAHDGVAQSHRGDTPVAAVEWLSASSGVPAGTIENIRGRRGAGPRYPTVQLRDADALVAALGYPEAFHDGTLTVRPNPAASAAAQAGCCGGSLTGGLP